MGNLLFGTPIYSDVGALYQPELSGGAWEADLPLTNLQSPEDVAARSSSVDPADTWFDADLQVAREVGVLALPGHTGSLTATVRWRGSSLPPAFDALTIGDADWTAVGTPTRVAAAFVCEDGVPLDKLGDDSVGATEYVVRDIAFTGNGNKAVRFRIARFSAYAAHVVQINDVTAAALRLYLVIDYSGLIPVVTAVTGAVVSVTDKGDGSYDVLATAVGVMAANTNRWEIIPAAAAASDVAIFYIGDLMAWDAATDQLVYDSGAVDLWPTGYDAETSIGRNPGFCLCPSDRPTARYWRVTLSDPANANGYLDLPRLIIAGAYQPTYNMSVGVTQQLSSASTRTESDWASVIHQERPRRRETNLVVEDLPESETLAQIHEMQHRLGTTRQLYFVFDPEDSPELMHRRSYVCVFRELSRIAWPISGRTNVPFTLTEELYGA